VTATPVLTPADCSKQMQQPPGRFGRQWCCYYGTQAVDLRWSSCQLVSDGDAERSIFRAAIDECRTASVGPSFIVRCVAMMAVTIYGTPCISVDPGQLSLAILPWVGATSTSESWDVNRHTARCTSPVSVVSQCKLVSG